MFSGMIAADPYQGGATWAILQYVLGFQRLGCNVAFIESVPPAKILPAGESFETSTNARYFREVTESFGLTDTASLLLEGTTRTVGGTYEELRRQARRADILINVSGQLTDSVLLESVPTRVYLDLDPAFVQLWHAVEGIDMRFDAHTHFVTIGSEIGRPECSVSTCGLNWIPTLQPIVLDHWPIATQITRDAWTTIGNWRGYGSMWVDGVKYGQKAHSMRQFFELPRRSNDHFAPAFSIHAEETADLLALAANGWEVLDPAAIAATPDDYRRFIQGSRGEFGIAKSGYVLSRCGWFSDRSVCYLASGRPVLAQDTGFSRSIPSGEGLLTFSNLDNAKTGVHSIRSDYARHARAARAIAETVFDSDHVLSRLLELTGVG